MKFINGTPGSYSSNGSQIKGKFSPEAIDRLAPSKAAVSSADSRTKHPGGRPTKRTPEITAQIAEAISFGLTDEEASEIVEIDDLTLTRWKKDPEFCRAIKSAVATRKLARLKRIDAGAPGWQGTAWALERQHPERFSRPEIQLNLCRSNDSKSGEHPLIWLQKNKPLIHEKVDLLPEEANEESESTELNCRLLPSVGDLDLSFDPE